MKQAVAGELSTYPLLGPRFWGTLLNKHLIDDRAQLEQGASPVSV